MPRWEGRSGDSDAFGIRFAIILLWFCQQPAALVELGDAMAVGEEAIMPDAVEAVRQRVQEEAADELMDVERHDLRLAAMTIILPAERNAIILHVDQAGIGDGDAMGVAAACFYSAAVAWNCSAVDRSPLLRTGPVQEMALNRKNALFAGSDGGGEHWATIASLIETCKLNGIDPYAYLADVIARIVAGHPQNQLSDLLPWAYAPAPLKAVA